MSAEESKENIMATVQGENGVKMAGYLDKRGKIKLMSTWKRYWFVLEGRLLLYYKSQVEYLNLSACRGSLNMGLVSSVRPGANRGHSAGNAQGYTIEVVTRSQVITLRTKERSTQEQWLQALLNSMAVSAPVRTSSGPLHFRYSLDNLPAAEEVEKNEEMAKEKQMTLPHRTSIARQNSLLNRIKQMGGQTYGGSLETIIKNQKQHNSPQQPKIPRIKAVDKMVGLQTDRNDHDHEDEGEEEEESETPADEQTHCLGDVCNTNNQASSAQNVNKGGNNTSIQNTGTVTIISIENQNNNIPNGRSDNSSNNHYNSECDIAVENKYYEKMQVIDEEREESLIKINNQIRSSINGEKMYEEVNSVEQKDRNDEFRKISEMDMKEDATYDEVTVLKSNNIIPEPDLPPRPGNNTQSKSSPIEGGSKYEDDYSVYYETAGSYSPEQPSSSPRAMSSAGEGTTSEKKKSKLRSKMRLRRKKSSSKESVASEGAMTTGEKKKHKSSFLSRMFKRYRKKRPKSNELVGDHCSSDEPEYETVDYTMAQQTDEKPGNINAPLDSPSKEKLFGKSLLPDMAMSELKMKLKNRDELPGKPINIIKEDSEGYESISSNTAQEKKPVPTPRLNKPKLAENGPEVPRNAYYSRINRPNRPPMLPPRGVARPPSPFHDIPTNNSPVYGNFQDLGFTQEPQNSNNKNSPKSPAEEWNHEIQDELLGTPEGFAAIQNKWRAVEKSVELHRDQGRLSLRRLPPKGRALEKSYSVENCKTEHCGIMTKCNSTEACIPLPKKHVTRTLSLDTCTSTSCTSSHTHLRKSDSYLPKYKPSPPRRHSQDEHIVNTKHMTNGKNYEGNSEIVQRQSFSQNFTPVIEPCEKNSTDIDTSAPVMLRHSEQQCTLQHLSNLRDSANICVCMHNKDCCSQRSSNQGEIGGLNHVECDVTMSVPCNPQRHSDVNTVPDQQGILPCLNRYSDELNQLLAQLAEITSAPLLPSGAATSLLNLPEGKRPKAQPVVTQNCPTQAEPFVLGPIRRRRHSDPDYDVPRPHGSLLHLLPSGKMSTRHSGSSTSQSGRDSDIIEATCFFGEVDLTSESPQSSMSLRHSVISEVEDPSDSSNFLSMTPDSLEVSATKPLESKIEVR